MFIDYKYVMRFNGLSTPLQVLDSRPGRWVIGPSPTWWSPWTIRGQFAWRLKAPSKTPKSSSNSTSRLRRWPPTTGRQGLVRWREGQWTHHSQRGGLHCAGGFTACCLCSVAPQTVVTLENGKLVQKQIWDGKETCIEREVSDGKLIAVRFLFCLILRMKSKRSITLKTIKNYAPVSPQFSTITKYSDMFAFSYHNVIYLLCKRFCKNDSNESRNTTHEDIILIMTLIFKHSHQISIFSHRNV